MEPRAILKFLREFSRRELAEKKADKVVVYRLKFEKIVRRGRKPSFQMRGGEGAKYYVCVFTGDLLRVYSISETGISMGAEDFSGAEKEKASSEISRDGKIVFRFSRK